MSTTLVESPVELNCSTEESQTQLKTIIMSTRDLPAMPQVASKVLEVIILGQGAVVEIDSDLLEPIE